jgi:hypothetical protein
MALKRAWLLRLFSRDLFFISLTSSFTAELIIEINAQLDILKKNISDVGDEVQTLPMATSSLTGDEVI